MLNLAVTITANSQFSSSVGSGNINKCKNIMKLNLAICGIISVLVCGCAFGVENLFIELFVVGEEMRKAFIIVYRMMIYVFLVGDFFSSNFSIFLKALNK